MNPNATDDIEEECHVQPMEMYLYWKLLLVILYGSVGIASLLGNLCVVLIVAMRKEMQTVTNIFISSVSLADLVITGVSLWATPLAKYLQVWIFGESMCYIVASLQGASLIWVPFTLAVIAIDRYRMIASPFRQQMSVPMCLLIIIGIWASAFAVLTPSLANLEYLEFSCIHKYCIENWRPHNEYRLLYGISVLIVRSGIPLTVITWCNWRIARIVDSQGNKFQRSTLTTNPAEVNRKQRLHATLKAMVIIFAVSSFPLDLFNVLQDLSVVTHKELVPLNIVDFLYFSSHWIAMTGNLLNPLVYAWWNENFRRQIQIIVAEFRGDTLSGRGGAYSVILSKGHSSKRRNVAASVIREKRELVTSEDGDVQV